MSSKEIISVKSEDKEIRNFLERLVAAGSLTINLDSEQFVIAIRRENVSGDGRAFLTGGGPDGRD